MVFQRSWRNRGQIQPPTKSTEFLHKPQICAWYVKADSAPGYNTNSTCIKKIKALLLVKKGSKIASSRGTCALPQAGLKVDPMGAVGQGARLVEESQ